MKKLPKIYVVLDEFHDYGVRSCEPVAWFFDEDEAYQWAEKVGGPSHTYRIEDVEPGGMQEETTDAK